MSIPFSPLLSKVPPPLTFLQQLVRFSVIISVKIDSHNSVSLFFSGLEVLIDTDERFRNYKNDLFSHKSRELDRDLLGIEENNRINASIGSYLRLLSGYFQLPSALKTLEYLIRRYK